MSEVEKEIQKRPQELLYLADQVIQQTHYEKLDMLPLCEISPEILGIRPGDVTCLARVTELVCNKEEGTQKDLTTVLNALNSCGATCIMLLQCREGRSELYLGAVNKKKYQNVYYLNTIRDILRTGIEGNLPGTELQEIYSREQIENKLAECLDDGFDTQCITAISCAANQPRSGERAAGLEKLLSAVGKRNFSILLFADPVESGQMQLIRQGYEELGTQLSEMESVSINCQSGSNATLSANYSETLSESLSKGISHTQSHSTTNGWSRGQNTGETEQAGQTARKVVSGIAALAVAGSTMSTTAGYFAMNAVSTLMGGNSKQSGTNEGESGSETSGETDAVTDTIQQGRTTQESNGYSQGTSESISIQTVTKDRHIQGLLSRLDTYLGWLNRCENYGMFNCCAYVISGSASVNLLVASQYQALMQGEGEMSQPVTINTWTPTNGVDQVRQSLLHLMHPTVMRDHVEISPAMLISSKELSLQMALPQESVIGVSVMEYASFGREVVRKSPMKACNVARVGAITHMGKVDQNQPILLDMQSLAAHTFIAGTNGSGKSNAIFRLLEELQQASIPFMVIEPAKGEYKNVFGRDKNIKVYGTNRTKTPLLYLNPFWFNSDVNVKEHIARLMDVFNASWPMYAAMPSVLNTAIESAYKACGWNLNSSRCAGQRIFPTVKDVLIALKQKMETTAFSEEVKGNYLGALSTRLESLCNGIYADIFSGADIGDTSLFEENVLIDLSRAGSPEISAMIMGILLIRLREYRMSEGALNHPLRHITVLEEAHHLLRRTSAAQTEGGANLMGKAVEMISNAIAEMRSYGDGFIIADQSPGLLDPSVLRNTNTKIILRLPEGGDRELVGDTIGLTGKQTYEISRLKTGVCVIYQKDWLEAVLCQVDRATHREELYCMPELPDEEELRRAKLIKALLHLATDANQLTISRIELTDLVLQSAISGDCRKRLLNTIALPRMPWSKSSQLITEIIPLTFELPLHSDDKAINEWYNEIIETNELNRNLDEASIRFVVAAHVWQRAKQHIGWKNIAMRFFPREEQVSIERIRGLALALLCRKETMNNLTDVSANEIDEWYEELSTSNDTDKLIADVLKKYRQTGITRRKGELKPYSQISWELIGGETVWQSAYSFVEAKNYADWDKIVRTMLSRCVICEKEVQTELLSLLLQHQGGNSTVRSFYYPWLAWTKKAEYGTMNANCEL